LKIPLNLPLEKGEIKMKIFFNSFFKEGRWKILFMQKSKEKNLLHIF
jgi:hypothetical protein